MVYESTVYPGVTEEICVPILKKESVKCGSDFKIGYSPERINLRNKEITIENIVKIVSGMDEKSSDIITKVYDLITKAGVYRAESIKWRSSESCRKYAARYNSNIYIGVCAEYEQILE